MLLLAYNVIIQFISHQIVYDVSAGTGWLLTSIVTFERWFCCLFPFGSQCTRRILLCSYYFDPAFYIAIKERKEDKIFSSSMLDSIIDA